MLARPAHSDVTWKHRHAHRSKQATTETGEGDVSGAEVARNVSGEPYDRDCTLVTGEPEGGPAVERRAVTASHGPPNAQPAANTC